MTKELVFDSWKGQEFSLKCPGVNIALYSVGTGGSFPGVKADDPSPFSAKVWVKIYNSMPPYAVMVHTGPMSLRLLHIWVQFYILNVACIVCTLIH